MLDMFVKFNLLLLFLFIENKCMYSIKTNFLTDTLALSQTRPYEYSRKSSKFPGLGKPAT